MSRGCFYYCDKGWFSAIQRPSRYIGQEINSARKDPSLTEVSIALAFPDVYEVGMSHLGLKILYNLLNSRNWISAERVFCPWTDMEKELRSRNLSLSTLESARPVSDFDLLGFSLQHELSYTNILNMLDLSDIPLLASKRDDTHPLVLAGGPACFNPEPVADIFDAIVIGDGEEAVLEICQILREIRRGTSPKREKCLDRLKSVRGVYIPSFFSINYGAEGSITRITPRLHEYQNIQKAIVSDIDGQPFPEKQVVPFTGLVHDRIAVEISRGCTRGCRFCQAGMIYRPVRERSPASIIEKAEAALRFTGYDELSLLSLSSGDYSQIRLLIERLMDRQAGENIALSLPSLRIDSMDRAWMEQIKRVRKTGFTLAPEAGNDRMRRIINKGLKNEDILTISDLIYSAGWNLIKLYFMIGLPGERHRDVLDIIDLSRRVCELKKSKGKRPSLNVSISTFVPKSHTPFMWMPQISLEESRRRINIIKEGLRNHPVKVKWNQSELSWLEGVFSRGDRRLCEVIVEAFKRGARFDSWGEQFRMDIWQSAFQKTAIDPESYILRERTLGETLPWDHIKSGVTKGFLWRERGKALSEESTPDCRDACLHCGVCDENGIKPLLCGDAPSERCPPPVRKQDKEGPSNPSHSYRLIFTKLGSARLLSHLELSRVLTRAFRRAGLKFTYSKGYHPMPKISFTHALPVGTSSIYEIMDIRLAEKVHGSALKDGINEHLPRGLRIRQVHDNDVNKRGVRLVKSHFLISLKGFEFKKEPIISFFESDCFFIVKMNKKREYRVDAKPLVDSMHVFSPHVLKLVVNHISGRELKPLAIIRGIFLFNDAEAKDARILRTRQIFS